MGLRVEIDRIAPHYFETLGIPSCAAATSPIATGV
jgi:hypothetical protein